MGFDLEEETVRVLTRGLDAPPAHLERGQTAAFARWIHEPYGAVFFIRRWQNDNWDTDCAITYQDADGRWLLPSAYNGSGWRNPFERPSRDDPVEWGGESASTVGGDDAEEWVRVFQGMVSSDVAKLEVYGPDGELFDEVIPRPDTPAVLVGAVGTGTYTVIAKGTDGSVLRDGHGREIRDVFEDDASPFDDERLLDEETASGGIIFEAHGGWRSWWARLTNPRAREIQRRIRDQRREWPVRDP